MDHQTLLVSDRTTAAAGPQARRIRAWIICSTLAAALLLGLALLPGTALATGGKSIAAAPPVVYGQQEFGNTATDQYLEDGCFLGFANLYRSYWSLSVTAGDLLTINWEGTPGTELEVMPVGTTDYTLFQTDPVVDQSLSSNGKNQAQYAAPVAGSMPLYFQVCASDSEEVPGPYDFTVTAQHALVVGLTPRLHIRTNSVLYGTATLASGLPAPDGLVFTLTATWPAGSASYSATSVGGGLAVPLALPESAEGEAVTFAVTRAADVQYQAAKSAELSIKVARPRVAPPAPAPKPLKCRRGFKKRQVHDKPKCVRVRHHHHRHPHRHHRHHH